MLYKVGISAVLDDMAKIESTIRREKTFERL
jgi:nuclear pore complex protein Nup155